MLEHIIFARHSQQIRRKNISKVFPKPGYQAIAKIESSTVSKRIANSSGEQHNFIFSNSNKGGIP